jgi:TP901 family phage tail tape measure protein
MFEELQSSLELSAGDYIRSADRAERASDDLADSTERLDHSAQSAGEGMSSFRESIGKAGAVAAAGGAAGIGAAAKAAASFESSMADVQKVTSEETAAKLESEFKSLATEIPTSQKNLATLGEMAGKFGVEGSENISKFVESVGKISSATSLASSAAGTRFAKIAGAVGLPMSEIDKLGNATNKLADTMKTDAGEITSTATRASNTLSQQLGLGKDAVLSLSASMNEVSPSARRAAGSLRRAAEALMDPKKAEDIASAIGLSTEKFRSMREESPEKLLNKVAATMNKGGEGATALRGSLGKAATAFSKIGKQQDATAQAQEAVNSQFSEGTSLQKEMGIRTGTAAGQWQLFKNQLRNVAITTGEQVLPAIKDVLKPLTGLLEKFGKFNERLSGIPAIGGLVATTVGGLVTAFAAFWPVIQPVATTIGGSLIPALSGVLAPLLAVGAAVGTLAAVFSGKLPEILLTVDRVFGRLPGLIDRGVSRAIGWVQNTAIPRAQQAFETLARRGAEAITLLQEWLPPRIRQAITAARQWLTSTAVPMLRKGFDVLVRQGSKAFDWLTKKLPPKLKQAVNAGMAWVRSTGIPLARKAMRRLGEMAIQGLEVYRTKILPVVRDALRSAMDWVQNKGVPLALNALRFLGKKAAEAFRLFKERLLPVIVRGVETGMTWLRTKGVSLAKKNLRTLAKLGSQAFSIFTDQLVPFAREAITAIVSWIRTSGLPLAKKGLRWLGKKAKAGFAIIKRELPPIIDDAISAAISWVKGPGVALAKSGLSALVDAAMTAWDVIKREAPPIIDDAVSAAIQWVKGPGISLAKSGLSALVDAAMGAWDVIKEKAPPIIDSAINAVVDWVRGPGVSIAKDALSHLADMAGDAWDAIKEITKTIISDAISAVQTYLKNQAVSDIKAGFETIGSGVRTVLKTLFSMGEGLGGVIATFITDTLVPYLKNDALGDLKTAATTLFEGALTIAKGIFKMGAAGTETIGGVIKGLIDAIVTYLKNDAGDDLKTAAEALFEGAMAAATGFAEGIIGDEGVIKTLIGDIVSYLKNDAVGDLKGAADEAFGAMAGAAKSAFNEALPDKIPSITIGGNTPDPLPDAPEVTIGGQSLDALELATGGFIEDDGLAMLHAGEYVLNEQQVDRTASPSTTAPATAGGSADIDEEALGEAIAENMDIDQEIILDAVFDRGATTDSILDEIDDRRTRQIGSSS